MPAAVKIKAGKYGSAIGLLLERRGSFQTRHERTLIVNSEQKKALEEADLVETHGLKEGSGQEHAHKKDEERAGADAWEKKVNDYTIAKMDGSSEDVFP